MSAAGESNHCQAFIGLGSNIEPEKYLPRAVALLHEQIEVLELSSVWETPPVGGRGADYLNAVACVQAPFTARDLRDKVLRPIESRLGRVRTVDRNAPRTIDLDILIYDGQVLEKDIWEQAFWSVPLAELVPQWTHPRTGETLDSVARRLAANTPIRLCGRIELKPLDNGL